MSTKADFESVAKTINRYGNNVGLNTYQFREFQLHEAADEHVIRFGYAKATFDPRTGEVHDRTDLPNRRSLNDGSKLFDYFAEAIWKKGSNIDGNMWLGDYQYQKISLGQHASMETITDHKTSRQVVKMVVDENGHGRVFMRYFGFDHDSLTRAYDEINYQ